MAAGLSGAAMTGFVAKNPPLPAAARRRAPPLAGRALPFSPLTVAARAPRRRGLGTVTCFVPQDTEHRPTTAPAPAAPMPVPVPETALEEEARAAAARRVAERKARKRSERRTYLVAAVMSSLGVTSMGVAAVYYRFSWQMQVGRRGAGDRDAGHICALRRRGGRDGVLGAMGAPGAVARLAVAHARVAPPGARGAFRAQRRVRHHQRRAGHLAPRLRLLPPGPRAGPLLRRGPRDYAVRHGLHVRPRRPGPPPLPRRPHRQRALLPASGCRPQDTPHGQVRGRPVWALPGTKGAGGGWWPGRAGEGARANRPEHVIPPPPPWTTDEAPGGRRGELGSAIFCFWFGHYTFVDFIVSKAGSRWPGPAVITFGCTGRRRMHFVWSGDREARLVHGEIRRHEIIMLFPFLPSSRRRLCGDVAPRSGPLSCPPLMVRILCITCRNMLWNTPMNETKFSGWKQR